MIKHERIIDKEKFIKFYKIGCPAAYELKEEFLCGKHTGRYDCNACWERALEEVESIKAIWILSGDKFKTWKVADVVLTKKGRK